MDNKFKMIQQSHQRPTQHHNLINQISSRVNSKRRNVLAMTLLAVLEVKVLMEIMELMEVKEVMVPLELAEVKVPILQRNHLSILVIHLLHLLQHHLRLIHQPLMVPPKKKNNQI